ncbi:meiosis regulator and mRNA stability factor 1 isoform X4 [Phacochoerus africanus]|uniref:meiosis regulator and mRNA stability factor 1 isoform X4 n=1 Tax=Phacochoerus africanus TaxID=41426 RepID=UPI001FD8CE17|nr:meiosis regulator and mRNA stability factor 1 isoform X4 [Phacochoerus africanus]
MMEGKGTENSCSRTLGWLQQDNDAKPWLWKFSNCFSRPEQTLPLSPQTKDYMENKKVAVELKDVPSPLHAGSKLFPAVPLPDIHSLQQPKIQLSTVPKGSLYCEDCLNKPARNSVIDAAKVWPNIPPPNTQTAPVTIPLCNGCGTKGTGKETTLLLATSLGKAASKFGSPEVAPLAGQVLENLPPIGVFWDIENCSVPSGRSATAVVQRIREKFFKGHREAEFICVCDISKENKEVIQELNNCQVTVAHINATAKNAADDKLRQSLRRFANTHTAPATVVLVSTDVNFALELSDLRHRHGFHIILVHKNQASEALLHHANELIRFEEFISDLPPRLPLKMPCHTLLYVYNLPANKDGKSISNRLRRLSDNCGGKVLNITGCSAILRFINRDSAERALKRMENEDVFGNRIIVSFTPKSGELCETKSSNATADKAKSPKKLKNPKLCLIKDTSEPSSSAKAAPGKGSQANSGSATKNTHVKSLQELCRLESKTGARISEPQQGHPRPVAPPHRNSSAAALTPKTSGAAESVYKTNPKKENLSARSVPSSPVEKKDKEETVFQVSYPSAFSKLITSRQVGPLLTSQSWSSRSMSLNPFNRASPLAFNVANSSVAADCPDPFANGADIQISNIDYRLSRKELQQLMQEAFSRHGKVKSVELSPHTDYQLKAVVQMENLQEAISAVNSLHRYKIGSKKILVSLATGAANKSLSLLSAETMSILQDAPACCLPLFKFTDIYEKKFGHRLNVSDLYKLTDTVAIREQGNGRLVCLLPSSQARQSPLGSSQSHDGSSTTCSPIIFEELEYHEPVCRQHCPNKDFSEHEFDPDSYKIPFVILSLKTFTPQVHSLLQTHEGTVPLLSFPDCYTAEFGELEVVQENREGGVPLEHLITCIPGVNIATAQNGVKVVKWIHNKPPPPNTDPWLLRSKSPVGNPQLIQFSREVIDLLKSQPSCVIPISNFIPSYHHHFAKQCRVSDYGYSKLIELLEAVPHVLQILGMGSKRLLTLTHRAQVKRFTQDLLKLLKSQASKQVIVREFSQAYHWCFSKDWDVTEYGVCELIDVISEIPDTTVCLSQQENEMVISIPKRERTQDEIERTKQFSKDVVDLLRHQPHFRMPFNKFIPSYHHHFGRQCKLAYYGFTKLLELFEAIPDILQVLECGEEKILTLTEVERFKALAAQFVKLLRSQKDNCLMMTDLLTEYAKTFGYTFRLQDYDVSSVSALTQKLCHVVKVADMESGKQIQLINRKSLRALTAQLLVLLMSWEGTAHISVDELKRRYENTHSTPLNPCEYGFMTLTELLKSLPYLVEVFTNDKMEECVKLTSLYLFAKNVRSLLHTYHYQQLFLHEFSVAYTKYVGETPQPKTYGFGSVEELLGAIPQVVWIKGHGHKRIVVLKNDMKSRLCSLGVSPADHDPQPSAAERILEVPESRTASELKLGAGGDGPQPAEQELLRLTESPVDLLCAPVPSCLPSPQLRPDPVILQSADLIQFEEHPQEPPEILILNQEEKIEIPMPIKNENLPSDSSSPGVSAAVPVPPCPSSETPGVPAQQGPGGKPSQKAAQK